MPGISQHLRLSALSAVMHHCTSSSSANQTPNSTARVTSYSLRDKRHSREQRRVVVMGAARVGKTCIINQFLYDKFLVRYRQTVEQLYTGEYELPDGSALTLEILDTSGSYEFPAMRTLSISNAGAFLLVFDVDDPESWCEVERLRNQILAIRGNKPPIVVVANKIDINENSERKVPLAVTEMVVCEDWNCGYVECSAKTNYGIVEVFKELLVQANIHYNLSPAVRRRRQSLPAFTSPKGSKSPSHKYSLQRHSCTMT